MQGQPQQQQKGVVVKQRAPAEWSTGLCDCCAEPGGIALCAMGFFCHCFVSAKNNQQIGGPGGYWGGLLATCIPILDCFCACNQANETLKQRNGGQPVGNDCCLCLESYFCMPCTFCRTRREQILTLGKARGYGPGSSQAAAAMLREGKQPVMYHALPQNVETEDIV